MDRKTNESVGNNPMKTMKCMRQYGEKEKIDVKKQIDIMN